MFACTKFWRSRSRDISFRARKPPQKFGVEEVAFSKYHKKYFTWLYISRSPFIPTNPLLAAMRIFSFFFQNNVRSSPNGIPPKKTKLHQMCYIATSRFCQKKLWILNWTPQRFGEIDAPGHDYFEPIYHFQVLLCHLFNTRTKNVWQAQIQNKKLSIHCDVTIAFRPHQLDIYWQLTSYYNIWPLIAPESLENSKLVKNIVTS